MFIASIYTIVYTRFNVVVLCVMQVIDHYLDRLIFPDTMEHRGLKLAANGQDVGGDMLFEVKLGFSGTPSDLLPLELGRSVTGSPSQLSSG